MDDQPRLRKPWAPAGLVKFVPDAALVRLILDVNGVETVPPALAPLLGTAADRVPANHPRRPFRNERLASRPARG